MKENRWSHCGAIIPEGKLSCNICEKAKRSKRDKVMMELEDIARVLNIDEHGAFVRVNIPTLIKSRTVARRI